MNTHGILLETGTNEVELLEVKIGGQSYGFNVLKVNQMVSFDPKNITKVYGVHPSMMGILHFRHLSMPLVNLPLHLHGCENIETAAENLLVVICEFNSAVYGFLVENLTKIYRISWDQIQSPPYLFHGAQSMITGIAPIEGREIMILDLESMVGDMFGRNGDLDQKEDVNAQILDHRKMARLFVADDSVLVRNQLEKRLTEAGFEDIHIFCNGEEIYEALMQEKEKAESGGQGLADTVNLVLTDIEMPRLDGLTLCKKLKTLAPNLPVMVLSSMITDQIISKCRAVGADDYLSKGESGLLISKIDTLLTAGVAA